VIDHRHIVIVESITFDQVEMVGAKKKCLRTFLTSIPFNPERNREREKKKMKMKKLLILGQKKKVEALGILLIISAIINCVNKQTNKHLF
jgi:hypothetical protein